MVLNRFEFEFSEIWLLPKSSLFGNRNPAKVVLANSFGNDDLKIDGVPKGNNYFFSELLVGNQSKKYEYSKASGQLSDEFHLFKMVWEPG